MLPNLYKMFETSWLKVVNFLVIWAVIWLPVALILSWLIHWRPDQSLAPQQKIILLVSLYLFSPIVLVWKIRAENLSLVSLGLNLQPQIFSSILLGLAFGVISLISVFWLEFRCHLITWHRENSRQLFSLLLPILLLSLFVSAIEETIFRGYIFSTLLIDYPYWLAATLSSIVFALLHLIWERKETLPQIPGLWLMGIILAIARIIDRNSIGLALGLHAAWIWVLTCIDSSALITYKYHNSWITGINKQPLAGIAGISYLIVTGLILWGGSYTGLFE